MSVARTRSCVAVLAVLALAGCKKELYTGLTERQANTMLSALLNDGIDTEKSADPKDTFSILVNRADLARAVDLLNAEGLPGERFVDMNEMYKKEGLISSPMEERVRYTFVLSQSIAETLTNIDGILTARVHIALPENDSFSDVFKPTSASVFIKYRPDYRFDDIKGEIKRIVENSIEGLSYDRISVFMSPSKSKAVDPHDEAQASLVAFGPLSLQRESVNAVKTLLLITLTTIASLLAAVGWLSWKVGLVDAIAAKVRRLARREGADGSAGTGDPARAEAGAGPHPISSIGRSA